MSSLKTDLKTSRKKAYADGTTKNLKIQWESYLLFCFYFGLAYLPANTETLSLYTQFLSRTFKSTHSIKNYISGVKSMHYLLGYSTDNINEFLVNLGIRGIARIKPYCIKQAKAITPDILLQFATLLNLSDPYDIVFWCLFLFAFFLFARKSNLVPSTKGDMKDMKFLLRKDIKCEKDFLIVSFRWSKTIQFGERVLETPLIEIPRSILCPVQAFRNMCKAVLIKPDDPLFTLPNRKCIWYKKFQSKLKELIKRIGLNPVEYSTHSFRRGGTTFAFKSKVPVDLIQLHGDWRSDAYKKYLSLTLDDKICVAEKMRQHILLN